MAHTHSRCQSFIVAKFLLWCEMGRRVVAICYLVTSFVRLDPIDRVADSSKFHFAHGACCEARFLMHRIFTFRQRRLTEAKLAAIVVKVWFDCKIDAHILLKETLRGRLTRMYTHTDTTSFYKDSSILLCQTVRRNTNN